VAAAESSREEIFLSICAPAYNEEETIETVVRHFDDVLAEGKLPGEIVIGNDGSTDRTATILQSLQAELPRLRVVCLPENRGYGAALSAAVAASRGKYVLTLDSDGQFDAAEFPALLAELLRGGYDLVTGYRQEKQDRITRVLADRAFNMMVRGLFRLPLRDTNCALKLIDGQLARALKVEARGFPTPTELLVKAQTLGYHIGEVAITHHERAGGTTKLKALRTSWQMAVFLVYLKYKQILYRTRILNSF
jgi:glycosyltransferase involved in cell wall biosynthesis